MKEFTTDSINYLVWELKIEFEIALTDRGKLNFDQSFLHFNVKPHIYAKVALIVNIEY